MQITFFDEDKRLAQISKLGDTLEQLNAIINWAIFVPILDSAIPRIKCEKGGRPPLDNLLMFKILIIKRLYNLSFDQTEFQINDRLSFMRFLRLCIGNKVPDAKTIWLYEDLLSKSESGQALFDMFFLEIAKKGYCTREGSIVDASFIETPKRRNTKEQRETLREGEIPEEWNDPKHPQKLLQRDIDATWTLKGEEAHFGYKDTVKIDADSKFIVGFAVTTASVSDLKAAAGIFDESDKIAYGDAAYPNLKIPENVQNKFSEKATRNHPLTDEQKANNTAKAKVRCRVEHVFAGVVQMVGGTTIRCKNLERATFNISLINLIYNMRRLLSIEKPTQNWVKRKLRLSTTG